jgi:hypothetical protein
VKNYGGSFGKNLLIHGIGKGKNRKSREQNIAHTRHFSGLCKNVITKSDIIKETVIVLRLVMPIRCEILY